MQVYLLEFFIFKKMNNNIKYGWIGLYRSITNHWLYPSDRTFTKYEAWIDILLMVNHSDKKVFNGSDTEICESGQVFTSQKKLMSKWKWSKSKLISFLKVLEKEQMIVLETTTKKTIIKVVNFQLYQDFKIIDKTKKDFKKTSKRLQKATNNNDNNYNNYNNDNIFKKKTMKTFNFKNSLKDLGVDENIISEWLQVRKSKRATNSETAFKKIVKEIEKTSLSTNDAIKISVENSWSGFNSSWLSNISLNNNKADKIQSFATNRK